MKCNNETVTIELKNGKSADGASVAAAAAVVVLGELLAPTATMAWPD
jgi:hypothetical protein